MAKISETSFAADAVKLWHSLKDLEALKTRLRERGLWRNLRAVDSRDKKLVREYFKARNQALAIVAALNVQIEH